MYKSLAKKLGISEIGCYSLRHEFATFLAQVEKCDQETQKQLMGWSTFMECYLHTDDTHKRKAICKIDNQYVTKNNLQDREEKENIDNSIKTKSNKENIIKEDVLLQRNNIIKFPIDKVMNQ